MLISVLHIWLRYDTSKRCRENSRQKYIAAANFCDKTYHFSYLIIYFFSSSQRRSTTGHETGQTFVLSTPPQSRSKITKRPAIVVPETQTSDSIASDEEVCERPKETSMIQNPFTITKL